MSAAADEAGRLPVGYEFVRLLGEGGNGWVALARQVQLDRLVAIKTIHAATDDDSVARLRREGRAIASLRHPNVVSVYELLVSSAGVSLVMEHVPGGDLRAALDENRLSGSHAVRVLSDVAAALEHAAGQGLVHRDVKPANVLLAADGRAKLADFGLARLPRSAGAFRTIANGAAGTPLYMAPEQIQDPELETPAIDAYAFAVMAYEVLVGARPFPAMDIPSVVYAHLYGTPIPPWMITPALPGPVGEILLGGLAKRPEHRPSPGQLVQRLVAIAPADWDAFFLTSRPAGSTMVVDSASAHASPANQPDWIEPPVYRLPARRRGWARLTGSRTVARLVGAGVGVVIGVVVAILVLRR